MSRHLIPVVTLALFGAACAGRGDHDAATLPAVPDSIFVAASNENFYDARVHAVFAGGQRRSLGTIAGNGGRTQMALGWEPRALTFEISFVISGAAYVSYPVDVSRGQHIEVRLPPNIEQSGFFRRISRS